MDSRLTAMSVDALRALARYNTWMNAKLVEVAGRLDDETRKTSRGVVFGSIHGLFNHLLVADRIWMARFVGTELEPGEMAPGIRALDQELFADFAEFVDARVTMDAQIEAWAATLTEQALEAPLVIGTRRPTMPLWCSAVHFFNHQTHHRGQLTALLSQAGEDFGVTDLVAMLRAETQA